jgi:hypothetical protein
MKRKMSKYYVMAVNIYPGKNDTERSGDLYLHIGSKPTLKDRESLIVKEDYGALIDDIRAFPKDRRKMLEKYVKVIELKRVRN